MCCHKYRFLQIHAVSHQCGWKTDHTDGFPVSSLPSSLLPPPLHPGIWAQLQMPQTSMEVIKGQMLVLRASYNTDPNTDTSTNTVLWNFVSNNTQLVRKQNRDPINSHIRKILKRYLFFSCSMYSILRYVQPSRTIFSLFLLWLRYLGLQLWRMFACSNVNLTKLFLCKPLEINPRQKRLKAFIQAPYYYLMVLIQHTVASVCFIALGN